MFTADHILFDITPNITQWKDMRDALGNYLDSLVKIRGYAMETALPAIGKTKWMYTSALTRLWSII